MSKSNVTAEIECFKLHAKLEDLQIKLQVSKNGFESLKKQWLDVSNKLDEALHHLKEVCAPEPDGFGGFVADEFMPHSILEARKFLTQIKSKKKK